MVNPTVDIIVPVWNQPFETRACLSSVLAHSPGARLIVVDNASSRETELMLEEFSEPLGDQALFITSLRNVGLVPAINMGLSKSDSDCSIILRPNVLVSAGWLNGLVEAASNGIFSPCFRGAGAPQLPPVDRHNALTETCEIFFTALALNGQMRMLLGGFDEQMDGGHWCLKDYTRRAWSRGYRTGIYSGTTLDCVPETVYGSSKRLLELDRTSRDRYRQRWGTDFHYAIYFGGKTEPESLAGMVETILEGARQGHRYTIFLHRRHYVQFRRQGWDRLHTSITVQELSLITPQRSLKKLVAKMQVKDPAFILVNGTDAEPFPQVDTAIPFNAMATGVTAGRSLSWPGDSA